MRETQRETREQKEGAAEMNSSDFRRTLFLQNIFTLFMDSLGEIVIHNQPVLPYNSRDTVPFLVYLQFGSKLKSLNFYMIHFDDCSFLLSFLLSNLDMIVTVRHERFVTEYLIYRKGNFLRLGSVKQTLTHLVNRTFLMWACLCFLNTFLHPLIKRTSKTSPM